MPPETNLLRFLLVLKINFQLLENKRNSRTQDGVSDWPSRIKFLAALLFHNRHVRSFACRGRLRNLQADCSAVGLHCLTIISGFFLRKMLGTRFGSLGT